MNMKMNSEPRSSPRKHEGKKGRKRKAEKRKENEEKKRKSNKQKRKKMQKHENEREKEAGVLVYNKRRGKVCTQIPRQEYK